MQRVDAQVVEPSVPRKLYREQGMLAGVSAGLGAYFGVNVTFVRIAFILTALGTQGLSVFAYLALWALVPTRPPMMQAGASASTLEPPSRRRSVFAYIGATFSMLASLVGFAQNVETVASYIWRSPIPAQQTDADPLVVPNGRDPELALRDFLSIAERAEVDAEARLDVSLLNRYYAGEALEQLSQRVLALQAQGEYMLARLDSQEVRDVRLQTESAEIDMLEVWSSSFHEIGTNRCVRMIASQPTPQTVSFTKYPDGWRITRFVFGVVPEHQPVPCASSGSM